MELTIKDLMKYTLGLILLTPPLALEMILNDTKMSISELNRLDTVSKSSKKDRLINELNEAKKNLLNIRLQQYSVPVNSPDVQGLTTIR